MTRAEILVVGAGPAGLAAAVRAAECGRRVMVLDDNPAAGGQIWRGGKGERARKWFSAFERSNAELVSGARVIAGDAARRVLRVETPDRAFDVEYAELILATGARELFLPFPGWTLPNVIGAGGLQALVKQSLEVNGKRIVVAGSGPLLLAVAAFLRAKGATVAAVVEQASLARLARFGLRLLRHPAKVSQAMRLAPAHYMPGSWVVSAEGAERVERAVVHTPRGTRTIPCEYLAAGFGLWPNTELAQHLGCRVTNSAVAVDEFQRTSVAGVYCAGEAAGIGGLDAAIAEGEIAGCAAGGREDLARRRFGARAEARRFAHAVEEAFAPRPELRDLPSAETIVCRCEDVRFGPLQTRDSWRDAKLHLRCGMGPCQGRICGPAAQWLFGWNVESVRPPIFPARVASLISEHEHALGGSDAGHDNRVPRGSDGGL